jgi:aldehyde:ferredoxin oxidoreductase
MVKGYIGRILRVDLSNRKMIEEELEEEFLKKYLGQEGIATRFLYNEVKPGISAFDPENRLIFMTGPLTGTVAPSCGRYSVVCKSPLTGAFGSANSGGFFGSELRFAGYDGLIVSGRSEKPVYLWIHESKVEIRDAHQLWGKDTSDTVDLIQAELSDRKIRVACIGPAGENLVRIASIITDKGRACARTGVGAVMGSKKLKAVAVRGTGKIAVVDEEKLRKIAKETADTMMQHPRIQLIKEHGTAGILEMVVKAGYGIVKNWTQAEFSGCNNLYGPTMTQTILTKRTTCFNCPVMCGRHVEIKDGSYAGLSGAGPEYETIAALGPLCMNDDLETVAKANNLCNRLGMDTISTGNIIAFAMECYEKGAIRKEDFPGEPLIWGDSASMIELIEKIARREEIGDILAEGVKRAAVKIGKGAEEFALEVKGLEMPLHDPRVFQGFGLAFATGNTGARHTEGMDRTTQADSVIRAQNLHAGSVNSLGLCIFAYFWSDSAGCIPSLLSAVTGWDVNLDQIVHTGEMVFNLKRAFNIRHGFSKEDDRLPKRFTEEPLQDGASKGMVCNLKSMIEDYYGLREWDEKTGKPLKEKLEKLGLAEVSEELYG